MAALAAEYTAMAVATAALGDLITAAGLSKAALIAVTKGSAALGEAALLTKQATTLQVQGAAIMGTAATVRAAGEIASAGLEMIAEDADRAAARREEILERQAEVQIEPTTYIEPASIAAPTVMGEAKNIVYQNVTFNTLLDTAKEDQLREFAEKLAPYTSEVEDRSVA